MNQYIALFEYDDNDGYGVIFPDLPGLATAGDDFDDAFLMAHEGLAFHLEGLETEGMPIPKPRNLEKIKTEWEDWKEWEKNYKFLLVPIAVLPASEKSVRVNVMFPEGLLRHIDSASRNRSAFLVRAAEHLLNEESSYKQA